MYQEKKDHHYLPIFHCQEWVGSDNKLFYYKKVFNGKIVCHKIRPKQVFFEKKLYTLTKPYKNMKPDLVEDQLGKFFDDKAAPILKKILSDGSNALTQEEKYIWALYINSLLKRHPSWLAVSTKLAESEFQRITNKLLDNSNEKAIENIKKAIKLHNDNFDVKDYVKISLPKLIKDQNWIDALMKFEWITISASHPFFILTDNPLNIIENENGILMISVAIHPKILWVCYSGSQNDTEAEKISLVKYAVMIYNAMQCEKQTKFIVSSQKLKNDGFHNYDVILEKCLRN